MKRPPSLSASTLRKRACPALKGDRMNRRAFIAFIGGAAAAWPAAAHAQQPAMPVVGFLSGGSSEAFAPYLRAFSQGLGEAGFVDGLNIAIEYRWAEGRFDQLPEMAADLVRRQVALIAATGGITSALAAKAATTTIPIVFTMGSDPVQAGLVASLSQRGNLTGAALFATQLEAKRFGMLHELVPGEALIAALLDLNNPPFTVQSEDIANAARAVGRQIRIFQASNEAELNAAFADAARLRAGGLLVGGSPSFNSRRVYIATLAARYGIPALYEQREFALAGGLMSYGTNFADGYRQAGAYAGRILRGEKPGDLPVLWATKFELVINRKTAKELHLDVPDKLLALANEVIE